MAQAKTLNQAEVDQVLRYIASKQRYAIRNKAMLLTSLYSGMRVGEIASLRVCDVQNDDGTIRGEIRLSSSQTKGNVGRQAGRCRDAEPGTARHARHNFGQCRHAREGFAAGITADSQ